MAPKKPRPSDPLSASDVARLLGLSVGRVRQLDAELHPQRTPSGRRIYRRGKVERFAAERAAGRGQAPEVGHAD